MSKIFYWILLLAIATITNAAPFYPNKGVDKIATLDQEIHTVTFTNDGSYKTSMDGSNFANLTINNNLPDGYDIYATATNGKLVTSTQKQYIDYTLTCEAFLTDAGGFIVPAATNISLTPGIPTLIYHIESPINTTVMAEASCNILPNAGQDINSLLAGNYSDSVVFSMQ